MSEGGIPIFSTPVDVGFGLRLTKQAIHDRFNALLERLILNAMCGDEESARRLQEIHKLLRGNVYAAVEVSVGVERAIRFYSVMDMLSYVVLPVSKDDPKVINASIELDEAQKSAHPIAYERAKRHWKKRCTLRTLTMRVFLGYEGKEFNAHSRRALERDLKNFSEWKSKLPPELGFSITLSSGETIPLYFALNKATMRPLKVKE